MTVIMEAQIRESLVRLLDAIQSSEGSGVAAEVARIDDLLAQARGTLPAQLQHFLERRSYAKALQFLGGATDIPGGTCGGRGAA